MKKNILITGATGIIGKELVSELQKRNVFFKIGLRDILKSRLFSSVNCPLVLLDYQKPQTFFSALEGVSDLFLATPIGHPNLEELIIPVLECAVKKGVKHVVSLGAIGVSPTEDSPLSVAEKCVKGCGLEYTILRPNFIMQNFLPLIPVIKGNNWKLELPVGYAKVSLVDAEDIAAAIAETFFEPKHINKTYLLTGNQSLDFFEIAHIISKITLKTVSYIPVTHNETQKMFKNQGWAPEQIQNFIALFEMIHQGWCEEIKGDLTDILGRETNSFESFIWKYRELWDQP